MKFNKCLMLSVVVAGFISVPAIAGPNYASGKITSLMASGTNPAIRLVGNISPDSCDGGTYGWLYFEGTAEEKNRIYATAMALSIIGEPLTVYTNSNGGVCKINNIQALGMNN